MKEGAGKEHQKGHKNPPSVSFAPDSQFWVSSLSWLLYQEREERLWRGTPVAAAPGWGN